MTRRAGCAPIPAGPAASGPVLPVRPTRSSEIPPGRPIRSTSAFAGIVQAWSIAHVDGRSCDLPIARRRTEQMRVRARHARFLYLFPPAVAPAACAAREVPGGGGSRGVCTDGSLAAALRANARWRSAFSDLVVAAQRIMVGAPAGAVIDGQVLQTTRLSMSQPRARGRSSRAAPAAAQSLLSRRVQGASGCGRLRTAGRRRRSNLTRPGWLVSATRRSLAGRADRPRPGGCRR